MELRKAIFEDWPLLLEWRNDAETRNNSQATDAVDAEQHKQWLAASLENKHRQLFIAIDDGRPVGTVRADYDEGLNQYELSWTVAPAARGKGAGKKMVQLLAAQVKGKIMARVKEGNISSVKIAESAGLEFFKKENGFLFFTRRQAGH